MNWHRFGSADLSVDGFSAGYDRLRRPDGERVGRFWLDPPNSVAIVAVDGDEVILIEEYRPRIGETFRSCPAGRVESGESFEDAGRRELKEETGYAAGSVELLESYYPVTPLRKRRGIVHATDLTPGEQALEADEFIEVLRVPVEDALDAVRAGPTCGWALSPLLLAREEGVL